MLKVSKAYLTSFKAQGFLTFRLEFHLPYLTMRRFEASPTDEQCSENKWDDLSFLRVDLGDSTRNLQSAIYTAHATIVISGPDHFKYIGFSILDPGCPKFQFGENDETQDDDMEGNEEYEDAKDGPQEDEFGTDGWHNVLIADGLNVDPRAYFVRAVRIRLEIVHQEYEYLVGNLESGSALWV